MGDYHHNSKCNICLNTNAILFNIVEFDTNNVNYLTKLEFSIPEVLWSHNYFICGLCIEQLNIVYNFKELCLKSFKMQLQPFQDNNICYCLNDTCSSVESDSEQPKEEATLLLDKIPVLPVYNCRYCDNKINDKKLLIKHNKSVHKSETPHDCTVCNLAYKTNKELLNHEQIHLNKKSPSLKCGECNSTFISKTVLNKHFVTKHTKKEDWKYNCTYCKSNFPTENYLRNHLKKTHSKTQLFTCFHCEYSFKDKDVLLKHLITKHQQNSENDGDKANQETDGTIMTSTRKRPCRHFTCEICSKILNSSKKLIKHCVNDHNIDKKSVRPFACDQCDKKFSTSTVLIEHKRYHARNRSNICSFCGKGFITKNDLNCHESIHFNERSYKCEVCFKGFNTQKNLRTHRIVKHGDPMSWKHCCNICNKRFAILSNFKVHVRRHMGDKQFACHFCDKKFVNKDELRQHVESHSKIREFKCEYCEKEYKKKRTYEVHLTKAHGIGNAKIPKREKKHMCHLCPKTYFDKSKLTKHLMTHAGIKPFACFVCDKKFTDNYYLKFHIRNTHDPEYEQEQILGLN